MNGKNQSETNHSETNQIEMGVLRVLTLEDPEEVSLHGRVIERHFPNVSTESRCIPDHPEGIPTVEAEAEALPYVEGLGREMAGDVDVLTVSCALDPAVSTLDDELDVPVVGAGASVAAAALARGEKVGTLGLESGAPPNVRNLLGERLQADETVEGAETTNYLTTEAGRDEIRAAVERLTDAGCDVVAPSCTGLTTSGVLADLRRALEIPVVDPVLAMAAMGTTTLFPVEEGSR
jgi:Asp/Glu/hydantoin racemase